MFQHFLSGPSCSHLFRYYFQSASNLFRLSPVLISQVAKIYLPYFEHWLWRLTLFFSSDSTRARPEMNCLVWRGYYVRLGLESGWDKQAWSGSNVRTSKPLINWSLCYKCIDLLADIWWWSRLYIRLVCIFDSVLDEVLRSYRAGPSPGSPRPRSRLEVVAPPSLPTGLSCEPWPLPRISF